MKSILALVLALDCLGACADPVFILHPDQMHYPVSASEVASMQHDGDTFAKAAGLAPLRPAGDFELRIWTESVWTSEHGAGTAWVLAKGRLTTYALTRPHDRLHAVRTSSRHVDPGKAPIAELRAAWAMAWRPGCDVSDANIVYVEAALDGARIDFLRPDVEGLPCNAEPDVRMTALTRSVQALAGR